MSADNFDLVMERLVKPISELTEGPSDNMFFMQDDGSFFFAEGYWHPDNTVIGKTIYIPNPEGKTKIQGRGYESLIKYEKDGEQISVSHPDQLKRIYHRYPDLPPDARELMLTEYHIAFPREKMEGYFDARMSLQYDMDQYPDIKKAVETVSELFEVPMERLGITGSSAMGRKGADIDLIFFGTLEENMDVAQKIWGIIYSQPERQVIEYGKLWPLRVWVGGAEICTFYRYLDINNAPIRNCEAEVVKEEVEAYGTVAGHLHSLYTPLILNLENVYVDDDHYDNMDLIIYDGSVRGEFNRGIHLHIHGKLVNIIKDGKPTLMLDVVDGADIHRVRLRGGVPYFGHTH